MKKGDKIRRLPEYQIDNWVSECRKHNIEKDAILTVKKIEHGDPFIEEFTGNNGCWLRDKFEVVEVEAESKIEYEIY